MSLEKYIGRIIVIIYLDSKGEFTQRTIRIKWIADGKASAYDIGKRAPRLFEVDRILAVQPGRTA